MVISESELCLQGRSAQECKYRFTVVLDPELVKGTWTKEEDERVSNVCCIYEILMKDQGWTFYFCQDTVF